MILWSDIVARRERYEDLMREAEQERLMRQMLAGRGTNDRLYARALAWLGRQLVDWGRGLQERCSACAASPTYPDCESRAVSR